MGELRPELALFRESLIARERRYRVTLGYPSAQPTAHNRNQIARRFLRDAEAAYLLMIDSDVVPQFNPLDYVERGLDVIGWPTPTWRANDTSPLVWHPCPPDGKGLVGVEWVSTSCILIARRVLAHPDMRAPFHDMWDADGMRTAGEDQSFCRRAARAGFEVWCDTRRMCAHFKAVDLLTLWRTYGLSQSSVRETGR